MTGAPSLLPVALDSFVERLTAPNSPFELKTDHNGPHFKAGPKTLVEIYRRARRMGSAPLALVGDATTSYADILEPGLALAGALRQRDFQGRRICIDLSNKVEWLQWFVAVTAAGASAVLTPVDGDRGVVADNLASAGCNLVVTRRDRPSDDAENLISLTPASGDVEDWTTDPDAEALVAFTSGSTGASKGVRHNQKGLLAAQKNMMLLGAVVGKLSNQAATSTAPPPRAGAPTPLILAPLYYVAGYSAFLLALSTGGRFALPRAEITVEEAGRLVEHHALTSIGGAGSDFIRRLVRAPAARESLRSLRRLQLHGAGLRAEICREVEDVLPEVQIVSGYGLTETGGSVASTPATLLTDGAGGGWVSPATAFRVRPSHPPDVGFEQAGELEIRGDMVTLGYLDPAQNAAAFTPDGWFRTGDLGLISDQGWLTVLGRRDGSVEADGVVASRAALEGVVRSVEGVEEAIINTSDEGRTLRIVVQVRDGWRVSEADVARALAVHARWTGAIAVDMREALPCTASGKVDRSRVFL
jgi:acyl-CoA synthetase (AMP-forming)/AMP-acid ligase II